MCNKQNAVIRRVIPKFDIWLLFIILCGLVFPSRMVDAHGGGIPQIANAPIGEYVISVWTDPEPLRAGTVHVTVGLAQESAAVLNRAVNISIVPLGNGQPIEAVATHENSANKFLYEADLQINRPGDYRFVVQIDDLVDQVSFVDTVEGASIANNPFVMGGVIVLVAVVALVGLRRGSDG